MSSEVEILKEILTELQQLRSEVSRLKTEQVKTNARLSNLEAASIELRTHDKAIISNLGQLKMTLRNPI